MTPSILNGSRTQMRKIVDMEHIDYVGGSGLENDPRSWGYEDPKVGCGVYLTLDDGIKCPYGKVGDQFRIGQIQVEIINIRVERINSISEKDAISEGISSIGWLDDKETYWRTQDGGACYNPIGSFRSFWEVENGNESWVSNPWVWVIEFKKYE